MGRQQPDRRPIDRIPKIGRGDPAREDGEEPSEYVVHEVLSGNWTGPADQSSSLWLAWKSGTPDAEQDGLYMGIVVTDDFHENANSGWNGDSVQMMVTNFDSEFMEHNPDDFALYNFALGGMDGDFFEGELPAVYPVDPENPDLIEPVANFERQFEIFDAPNEYVSLAINRDEDASETTYEIFLGVEALGLEAEQWVEGGQLGIAMAINDGDEDLPGQTGWVGLGAHAIVFGKSPSEAAVLTLGPVFDPGTGGDTCASGDLDGNGMVEFADFLILSGNFGNAVDTCAEGDIDGDGTVAFADFLVLSGNFGTEVAAASVPEPASLTLFAACLFGMLSVRRRR